MKYLSLNKIIITIVVIIGLYAFFLVISDITTVYDKISKFNLMFLPAILIIVTSSWFILIARWYLFLKNVNIIVPKKDNIIVYLSGTALSIIPGKVGELIKSQLLKTKFDIPRTKSAPIVVIEQLYNVIGIIIASLFGIWFFEIGLYVVGVFTVVMVLIFYMFSSEKLFKKSLTLIGRIKLASQFVEPLFDSYDVIKKSVRGPIVIYSSALSALFWIIESLAVYLILLSFGINHIEFLKLIPIYTTSIILGVASFLPLGVGVVEGSLTGFLTLQGIDVSTTLTLVIFIRIFTRWYTILIGFLALKLSGGFSIKNNS